MRTSPLRLAGVVGVTAVVALGAVACSSGSSTSTSTADQSSATTIAQTGTLTQADFGPGCAAVPTSGAGSFQGMAQDPAATAASNNPALSTLVSAVKAAGLVDTLNGPGPFTIFAPTDDAFAKMPQSTLSSLMADPTGQLTSILTYHVISGKSLDAAQLAADGTETTVNGAPLTITRSGDTIQINGQASVVCGNVKVGNGTVQIIDSVLMPPATDTTTK